LPEAMRAHYRTNLKNLTRMKPSDLKSKH